MQFKRGLKTVTKQELITEQNKSKQSHHGALTRAAYKRTAQDKILLNRRDFLMMGDSDSEAGHGHEVQIFDPPHPPAPRPKTKFSTYMRYIA